MSETKRKYDDNQAKHEGWALFTNYGGPHDGKVMIQRLDDPQSCGDDFPAEPVFKSDAAAIAFVRRKAKAGSAMHKAALKEHGVKWT